MKRRLLETWDRTTLYLPILLMAFFALGSWWLVRSAPSVFSNVPPKSVRHEPDYFLNTFAIRTFDDNGQLKSEIFGADARHFPDNDTLEIENVRMRAFDDLGRTTIASAQRALSNRDGSDVQMFGKVHLIRSLEPEAAAQIRLPVEYHSEYLHARRHPDRLSTNLPVVVTQGRDSLSGSAMTWDQETAVLQLDGRVHGVLHSRRTR